MPAVSRMFDKDTSSDMMVEGSKTVFAGDSSGGPSFSNIPVTMPKQYDVEFALPIIRQMGRAALFDEPQTIGFIPEDYPSDIKEAEETDDEGDPVPQQEAEGTEENNPTETPLTEGCPDIGNGPLDPNTRVSEHFTVADFGRNVGYGQDHVVRAQKGLSEQEIVCNLHGLATNVLEPVYEKFGPFTLTSGFRNGNDDSQHNLGQAADIQEPSWSNEKHLEVAKWMAENTPNDQLLFEHGNRVWIHVSHNVNNATQRGEQMTMINEKFEKGLRLYY